MSASTKKGGGTLGVNPKTENNGSSSGGNGGGSGGGGSGAGSKGDLISTTPSKSSKHGVTKNKSGGGNANTPNSKSNSGGIGGLGNDGTVNTAILNQQALEALYSATYVEDFIDCNDNMGDDLIRQTTRMFEMGSNYMSKSGQETNKIAYSFVLGES